MHQKETPQTPKRKMLVLRGNSPGIRQNSPDVGANPGAVLRSCLYVNIIADRGLGACAPATGRDYCQRSAGGANARSRWLGRKEVSGFQPIKSVGTQTMAHHFTPTRASQTAIFLLGSGTLSFVLSKESVPAGPGAASPEIPAAGVAAYKAYPPWRDKK